MPRGQNRPFWSYVQKGPGCWIWTGAVDRSGYGIVTRRPNRWNAHRLAWFLTNGEIPAGRLICHRCDNRLCCRPDHLYVGTPQDNALDRSRAGTQTGSRNGFAKLSESQVQSIKKRLRDGEKVSVLAADYAISPAAIYMIRNGINWRQVA